MCFMYMHSHINTFVLFFHFQYLCPKLQYSILHYFWTFSTIFFFYKILAQILFFSLKRSSKSYLSPHFCITKIILLTKIHCIGNTRQSAANNSVLYKITQFIYPIIHWDSYNHWGPGNSWLSPFKNNRAILHFLDLIRKFYFHTFFFIRVISLTTGKMAPILARATKRTKNFSLFFFFFYNL